MARTLGAKNRPKVANNDGYANAVMGTGTARRDRSTSTYAVGGAVLDQDTLERLYMGDGFARRIVDIVANDATRAGFDIDGIDEEQEDKLESALEALSVNKHIKSALTWSRLYGGSLMILGVNDGGTLEDELNLDNARDFEFIRVYDRYQATVHVRNTDPASENYGQPESWLISPTLTGTMPYKVHNSRCIILDGAALPDRQRSANENWGASCLQACTDQLTRLGMSHQHANALLERSQQAVHKITDLAQTLARPNGEALIKQRVDLVDMVRGILNTIVVDGNEEYSVNNLGISSGVKDVLNIFAEALSAVTGIPVYLLMGRSIGGLNANGDSEQEGWYATVKAYQEENLTKPIEKIVSVQLAVMGIETEKPWHIEFNPLKIDSEKERAEVEKLEAEAKKIQMETDIGYIDAQVIDPPDLRKSERISEMYPDVDLSLEITPEPLPEPNL